MESINICMPTLLPLVASTQIRRNCFFPTWHAGMEHKDLRKSYNKKSRSITSCCLLNRTEFRKEKCQSRHVATSHKLNRVRMYLQDGEWALEGGLCSTSEMYKPEWIPRSSMSVPPSPRRSGGSSGSTTRDSGADVAVPPRPPRIRRAQAEVREQEEEAETAGHVRSSAPTPSDVPNLALVNFLEFSTRN